MTRTFALALIIATLTGACSTADRDAASNDTDDAERSEAHSAAATADRKTTDSVGGSGVPVAVADVGRHGEDLYDQATLGNWDKATVIMDSLQRSAGALRDDEREQMRAVLDTLQRAVTQRLRDAAIAASNRVTFLGAGLTEAYSPKMPAAITRLDYYGRELEIHAAHNDMARLRATSAALRGTWDSVKSSVIARGGAAAAARTDSLVAQLLVARSAADFATLATPILDVVDELEKPFEK